MFWVVPSVVANVIAVNNIAKHNICRQVTKPSASETFFAYFALEHITVNAYKNG